MPPMYIPWLRVALWTAGTAIIVTLLWLPRDFFRASDAGTAPPPAPEQRAISMPVLRLAAPDEWTQPIAELGRRRCAKQLVWHGLSGPSKDCRGQLAWWHDGSDERLAYLPAEGESMREALQVVAALRDGQAAFYEFHGDLSLRQRLDELGNGLGLPAGYTLLTPPTTGSSSAAP